MRLASRATPQHTRTALRQGWGGPDPGVHAGYNYDIHRAGRRTRRSLRGPPRLVHARRGTRIGCRVPNLSCSGAEGRCSGVAATHPLRTPYRGIRCSLCGARHRRRVPLPRAGRESEHRVAVASLCSSFLERAVPAASPTCVGSRRRLTQPQPTFRVATVLVLRALGYHGRGTIVLEYKHSTDVESTHQAHYVSINCPYMSVNV